MILLKIWFAVFLVSLIGSGLYAEWNNVDLSEKFPRLFIRSFFWPVMMFIHVIDIVGMAVVLTIGTFFNELIVVER